MPGSDNVRGGSSTLTTPSPTSRAVKIPPFQLVRNVAPQPRVDDVPGRVREAWLTSTVAAKIAPGMRVAVGCGSRGIRNYLAIARATSTTAEVALISPL